MNKLFFATLFFISNAYACTEEEANNKMIMLGRAQHQMMNGSKENPQALGQAVMLAMEVSNVGKVMAEKKYKEACQYYDQIALKFKIDFKEYAKDTLKVKDYKQMASGKYKGCTFVQAKDKMMATVHELEDKVALGEADSSVMSQYIDEATTYNDFLYTNPNIYCAKMAELRKKYLK